MLCQSILVDKPPVLYVLVPQPINPTLLASKVFNWYPLSIDNDTVVFVSHGSCSTLATRHW